MSRQADQLANRPKTGGLHRAGFEIELGIAAASKTYSSDSVCPLLDRSLIWQFGDVKVSVLLQLQHACLGSERYVDPERSTDAFLIQIIINPVGAVFL